MDSKSPQRHISKEKLCLAVLNLTPLLLLLLLANVNFSLKPLNRTSCITRICKVFVFLNDGETMITNKLQWLKAVQERCSVLSLCSADKAACAHLASAAFHTVGMFNFPLLAILVASLLSITLCHTSAFWLFRVSRLLHKILVIFHEKGRKETSPFWTDDCKLQSLCDRAEKRPFPKVIKAKTYRKKKKKKFHDKKAKTQRVQLWTGQVKAM